MMNMIIGVRVCVTVMNSGCGIEKGYRSPRVLNFKQGHRPVAAAPLIALDVCVFSLHPPAGMCVRVCVCVRPCGWLCAEVVSERCRPACCNLCEN